MDKLRVDIWSDIACPWCYIGKRHFEAALAATDHAGDIDLVWHSFELDPSAPKTPSDVPNVERLARKYRVGVDQARAMIDRVAKAGEAAGLDLRLHESRPASTFDAHRLLHWAHERGAQDALKERLLRGYQTESLAISDHATLARLAGEAGLDATEALAVLTSDRYAAEVRADEGLARELGISGVPFFVLDGRIGLSGAQPITTMREALEQAFASHAAEAAAPAEADGAACTPDGCD